MSELQKKAIQMINELSDENVSFVIEAINSLTIRTDMYNTNTAGGKKLDRKMQAFQRLDKARAEISQYFPEDFDPEKELEEN